MSNKLKFLLWFPEKSPIKDSPRTGKKANPASENSSLIFTVCVKSVQLYRFKLVYVVLRMAVKEFFESHF